MTEKMTMQERIRRREAEHDRKTIELSAKAYKDVDLIPANFYNAKTGKFMNNKTFNTAMLSRNSAWNSKRSPALRQYLINMYKEPPALDTSKREYLDRIEKKVKKIKDEQNKKKNTENKKVQQKAKGGMIIGPSYRHGHKDYRNGGVSKRIK